MKQQFVSTVATFTAVVGSPATLLQPSTKHFSFVAALTQFFCCNCSQTWLHQHIHPDPNQDPDPELWLPVHLGTKSPDNKPFPIRFFLPPHCDDQFENHPILDVIFLSLCLSVSPSHSLQCALKDCLGKP